MTTSALAARLGSPRPRVSSHLPYRSSAGAEVVELARSAGLILEPWQAYAAEVATAEAADGRWAHFEVGMLVARQNGKGAWLEAIELAGLFLFEEQLIIHSAHEFKTARDHFRRMKALITGTPALAKRVKAITTGAGNEAIELHSGAQLRFIARSKGSGRGFPAQRLVLDECQELPEVAVDALLPTLSAQPNAQVIYTGTVPGPTNNAEHFQSVRDRGRAGGAARLAWMEWTTGSDPKFPPDPDDRDAWVATNPGTGHGRMTEESIARERDAMSVDGFLRERLSWWPDDEDGAKGVIPLDEWAALASMEQDRPSPVALAVQVSPDRKWATIALAGVRSDGHRHVQVVQSGHGTGWVPARIAELVESWDPVAVAVAPGSPAGSLIPDLNAVGVEVMPVHPRDMVQGCGSFLDGVREQTIHHPGQQVLDIAVAAAGLTASSGPATWVTVDPKTDIAPLEAATMALLALVRNLGARPKRSGDVW